MTVGPAIILIIVAAIAGYVIGIVDSRITASMRKKIDETAAETEPAIANAASAELDEQNKLGEHTVLKVSINKALKWRLELDGTWLEDPAQISAEQRQRVVNVVMQMRPWIDGKPAQSAAPLPMPMPAPEAPAQRGLSSALPAQTPVATSTPPRIDALRGLRTLLKNEIKSPSEMKSISIVSMIDDVLQDKLLGSNLAGRGIRLEEGGSGEVIVFVGPHRYSGVDAVPEPEIQAMIRGAIKDWEKKA